ncbi:hypothetical protein D9611_005332 [Ephemerocybe angulata]|uniref:Uncharacterized protein n=1 Tax=Ephemerocybe angulata TaxID=980116 RepID=A0A8H5C040_9AGAR|nr:hypothetical protein D9611_005332 [Tulosesus angulatus]
MEEGMPFGDEGVEDVLASHPCTPSRMTTTTTTYEAVNELVVGGRDDPDVLVDATNTTAPDDASYARPTVSKPPDIEEDDTNTSGTSSGIDVGHGG